MNHQFEFILKPYHPVLFQAEVVLLDTPTCRLYFQLLKAEDSVLHLKNLESSYREFSVIIFMFTNPCFWFVTNPDSLTFPNCR